MTKLLLLSAFLLLAQTPVSGADSNERQHGWDPNKVVEHWGTRKRGHESFDASFAAIKRVLEDKDKLNAEKIEFLSDWTKQLLAGQKFIKERAEKLREDPTIKETSKNGLLNRIVLYNERIKNLNDVKTRILQEKQLLALRGFQEVQQEEINRAQADKLQKQLGELETLLKNLRDN